MKEQDGGKTPKKGGKRLALLIAAAVILAGIGLGVYLGGRYVASTVRLLRMQGSVSLQGSDGTEKSLEDNMRLHSGSALSTGERSLASMGLDDTKIITLNENSRAEFFKRGRKIQLRLTEGRVYFQVSKKLSSDESFDIRTSTMVVGIRGTSGYVSVDEYGRECVCVTDGTVLVTGVNPETGEETQIELHAGERASVYLFDDRTHGSVALFVERIEDESVLPSLIPVCLAEDHELMDKVCADTGWDEESLAALAAEYDLLGAGEGVNVSAKKISDARPEKRQLRLCSQSASAFYTGAPLTAEGYSVDGLDEAYRIEVDVVGSQREVGSSENRIAAFRVFDAEGRDVSGRYVDVMYIDGTLTVAPVGLHISTDSAEKVYDGKALTAPGYSLSADGMSAGWLPEAYGGGSGAAFVCADGRGNETLYVLCGTLRLSAVNPLTGVLSEREIPAGVSVCLQLEDGPDGGVRFLTTYLEAGTLPEALLRSLARDDELRAAACRDGGLNAAALERRIAALGEDGGENFQTDQPDTYIQRLELTGRGCCYRIRVDSAPGAATGRSLRDDEAMVIISSGGELPTVKVTGKRTEVGESPNTYTLKWHGIKKDNYRISETLGTLRVTPQPGGKDYSQGPGAPDGSTATGGDASPGGSDTSTATGGDAPPTATPSSGDDPSVTPAVPVTPEVTPSSGDVPDVTPAVPVTPDPVVTPVVTPSP